MADINRVTLAGRLTRDAELRSTPSGTEVLAMSMCVNDRRKNQQTGEWEDVPNYIDVTFFGKSCSWLFPMMTKGARVALDGRLRWSSWEREGVKRSKLEVIADVVFPMASQQPQAQDAYQQPSAQQQADYVPPTLARDAGGGVSAVYQQQPQQRAPRQAPGQMVLSADPDIYREQMAQGAPPRPPMPPDEYGDEIPF